MEVCLRTVIRTLMLKLKGPKKVRGRSAAKLVKLECQTLRRWSQRASEDRY